MDEEDWEVKTRSVSRQEIKTNCPILHPRSSNHRNKSHQFLNHLDFIRCLVHQHHHHPLVEVPPERLGCHPAQKIIIIRVVVDTAVPIRGMQEVMAVVA